MARHRRVRQIFAAGLLVVLASLLPWHAHLHAQTPGLNLVLTTNQSVFGTGTTLEVTLGVEAGGASGVVDLLFGAILPDGDSVVFFEGAGLASRTGRLSQPASLRPMLPSLALAPGATVVIPDFFRYVWQGSEPQGAYRLFFAATRPNALRDGRIDGGDMVALRTATITLAPRASITVDPARSSSASISIGGGTVRATAADGTIYSLDVPPGALAHTTTVTLTPVTSLTGLTGGLALASAVRAEPEGLTFLVPATLSIDLPPGTNPARVVGLTTTSTGAGTQFLPADSTGASGLLIANVTHFSIVGAAIPATTGELPPSGTGSSTGFLVSIAFTPNDHAALQALFISWFDTIVRPLLIAGRTDVNALLRGMTEYYSWEANRVLRQTDVAPPLADLQSQAGKVRVAENLRLAIPRLNDACVAGRNLARAEDVLRLQSLGASYFHELTFPLMVPGSIPAPLPLFDGLEGLDLASVVANLCVSVDITNVTLPAITQPGVAAPVTVRAGLAVRGGGLPMFAPPLQIRVDAAGASPTQRVGQTNATGDFATTFTPTGVGITLGILAAFIEPTNFPYLSLATLTDTATAGGVGAVVVSPSQTTIGAGASRQFSAAVAGTTNQAVTWTVSGGGAISSSGLFTSSGALGTFFVTATSVADPNALGIAQVTVAGAVAGALAITTSASTPTAITVNARRGVDVLNVTRPTADVAALMLEVQQFLGGVTALEAVSIVVAAPVAFSLNLAGISVTGEVTLTTGGTACAAGTVVPATINLRLGVAQARTLLRSCGATFDLVADSLAEEAALLVEPSQGGRVTVSAGFVRSLNVTRCVGGTAIVNIPRMRDMGLFDTTNCNASVNGTAGLGVQGGNIQAFRNTNSSFGTLRGSDLTFLAVSVNAGTAVVVEAGNIVGGLGHPGTFIIDANVGVPLSAIRIGNIAGPVTIQNNRGFTNAAATAFLSARTVGGAISISGNQQ